MANYIDDFQSATVGAGLPSGWTDKWQTSVWSVIQEGSDKILSKASATVVARRCVTLDVIDSDADNADSEVLVKLRVSSLPAASNSGAVLRASGTSSVLAQGYACSIYGTSGLRVNKYISSAATVVLTTTTGLTLAANTWYWLRFRVTGSALKGRLWADGGSEPGTWAFEITDTDITGAGGAGLVMLGNSIVHDFAEVAIATNGGTATVSADTTAPVLTSPTGTTASATTATGTVTTDEANGTLYFLATTNSTELASTVITGGATGGTQAISSTGVKNVNVSGLTASTAYYLHYVHVDAALNTSTRVSSSSFTTSSADVTAPTLSAPSGTQTGATTATLSVTTDENNGVLYTVVTTSATPPSAAQIRAGQNNAGTAAVFASNQTITSTGAKSFSATGLAASTTYYTYFHHRDASTNDSTVSAASSFTTAASGVKGARISLYSGSTAQASLTGLSVCWWDMTTPHTFTAPLLTSNSETTDSIGTLEINLAGVTALAIGAKGFLLVYKNNVSDTEDSFVFAGQVAVSDIS